MFGADADSSGIDCSGTGVSKSRVGKPGDGKVSGSGNRQELIGAMVSLYLAGNSLRSIARAFGMSHMTVYRLLRGRVRMRPRVPEG